MQIIQFDACQRHKGNKFFLFLLIFFARFAVYVYFCGQIVTNSYKGMVQRLLFLGIIIMFALAPAQAKRKATTVRLETTAGVIRVELSDETPRHRDNFIKLCREGYYNGTLFHRVIKDFMIQGGSCDARVTTVGDSIVSPSRDKVLGDCDPGYTIPAEFNLPWLFHERGALAAARESDDVNPEMRSSGSQFYIVYGRSWGESSLGKVRATLQEKGIDMDREMWNAYLSNGGSPHLDGTYTVFGHVIDGMKVVKQIQAVATDKHDRPLEDVVLLNAIVEK